jgi:hypothetical protein
MGRVPLYLYKLPFLSSCKFQRYIKNDIHIVHLIPRFRGRKTTLRKCVFFSNFVFRAHVTTVDDKEAITCVQPRVVWSHRGPECAEC